MDGKVDYYATKTNYMLNIFFRQAEKIMNSILFNIVSIEDDTPIIADFQLFETIIVAPWVSCFKVHVNLDDIFPVSIFCSLRTRKSHGRTDHL